ncbi:MULTISPECIES: hypothetical protein [Sorangium]|uniref:Secreted protein n=1 Tax=Sorangium cellulosum TaxID=56 RepID=A0A4P2QTB8_SORCE|nr:MULTISPECIES: hypothetical protein [Sorangium]AUX33515.1 uncharacterized protein SOCE836_056750 [Sorangium cellulosum]WCQ92831.1 hypothetical protein NQZ70_05577 [Sorangium sp. Soce836]
MQVIRLCLIVCRCAALALLFGLALERSASAQDNKGPGTGFRIALNLEGDPGDFPSHVCVISVAREGITLDRNRDSQISLSVPEPEIRSRTGEPDQRGPKGGEAIGVSCLDERGPCEPKISIPRDTDNHRLVCAKNTRETKQPWRVAVIHLREVRYDGGTASANLSPIDQPRLDGNVVTLSVRSVISKAKTIDLVGAVIGGHYAESSYRPMETDSAKIALGEAAPSVRGIMRLPLIPRCRTHEIVLPPGTREVSARAHLETGREPFSCDVHLDTSRQFKMRIPYVAERTTKRVVVVASDDRGATSARYTGTWIDFEPPPAIELKHTMVRFSWKRDCLYPKTVSCPAVTVVSTGLACRSAPSGSAPDVCDYVCGSVETGKTRRAQRPGAGGRAARYEPQFSMPARLRFARPKSDEAWEDTLAYGNQLLSGFVSAADRRVDVSLRRWGTSEEVSRLLHRRAAGIEWLVVRGPTGTEHYVRPEPDSAARLWIPGVSCGDVFSFRIVGERAYHDDEVKVTEGVIEFPHPESQEIIFLRDIALGGIADLARRNPAFPAGDEWELDWFGFVRGVVGLRPRGTAVQIELRASFMLGSHLYYPLRAPGELAAAPHSEDVLFSRSMLEAGVFWIAWPKVHLGGSAGLAVSAPIWSDDFRRAGAPQPALTWGLAGRYLFTRRTSVELGQRFIYRDLNYTFSTDFRGAPTWSTTASLPVQLELGLRIAL